MFRKLLIGLSLALLALVVAGFFVYRRIQHDLRALEAENAEVLKRLKPGIVIGEGRFERTTFLSAKDLGYISQIRLGWPANLEAASLTIVGSRGADFLDLAGTPKKTVTFQDRASFHVVVAHLPSGDYGYLTRNQSWASPATLYDKSGQTRWTSDSWPGVNDSVDANLDGDGRLSVVVGYNGRGGIELLNGEGKRVWKKDDVNVWHVESLDVDGNGRDEILHSNAKGELKLRNASGDVVARYLPDHYVSNFSLTRWGREDRPTHIFVPTSEQHDRCCKRVFIVLDARGNAVAEFESPLSDALRQAVATPVDFGNDGEYFAILQTHIAIDRSLLLLFDRDRQLVYQEILPEACQAVASLPRQTGQELLVGCEGKVLAYSLLKSAR